MSDISKGPRPNIEEALARWTAVMRTKLEENEDKGGWVEIDPADLRIRLDEELEELDEALSDVLNEKPVDRSGEEAMGEAADVALLSFMTVESSVLAWSRGPTAEEVNAELPVTYLAPTRGQVKRANEWAKQFVLPEYTTGGNLSYEATPTGLGTVIKARVTDVAGIIHEEDFTDYDAW